MGLETGTYLNDLNTAYPVGASDLLAQGDDHIRLLKTTIKNTFPNMGGAAWRVQSKGSNYTLAATDNMSVIRGTASITLTTEAAATIGNGFIVIVVGDGGDVVIDPNGAETVNGNATLTVLNNSAVVLYCNGSLFYALQLMIPNGVGLYLPAGQSITFEGTTADAFELTVSGGEPTADRTQTHQDATGTLALIGVKEVIGCFPAAAMKVPTTAGAATLAWDESATYKVMTGYLAFDKDTQEHAQFSFRAPNALDESAGFTARFIWKEASSATAHNCVWQIEMQAQGDADTIDSAWGTAVTVTDTGAASKRYISAETAAITPGGTWAAGDEIIVRVSRKATDGADTLDVDAHLLEVVLMATYATSAEA